MLEPERNPTALRYQSTSHHEPDTLLETHSFPSEIDGNYCANLVPKPVSHGANGLLQGLQG